MRWLLIGLMLVLPWAHGARETTMALPKYDGQWVQLPGGGGWINTAGPEYMTPISDADYQANQAELNPREQYIKMSMPETGGFYQTLQAPTPEMLQGGALRVAQQIIAQFGPGQGGALLGILGNMGYFDQFPDYPQVAQQIGEVTAQLQAAADTGDAGPGGLLKGALIHGQNVLQDAWNHPVAGAVGPVGGSEFGGESSNFWGQPSDQTYADQGSQGVDVPASQWMNTTGRAIGMSAAAAGASNAMGTAGAAPAGEGYTQLAEGGNTATDVPLTGGGQPSIAEQYANVAEWGDPSWSADPNWHGPAPQPNVQLPSGEWAYGSNVPATPQPQEKTAPGEQKGAPSSIDNPAPPDAPQPQGSNQKLPDINAKDTLQTGAAGLAIYSMLDGDSGATAGEDPHETEAERQARIAESTRLVNEAFAGYDDNYFSGIADAYRNYQSPIYQDQVANARRRLPMSVPHTQSSAYNRKAADLELDIQRGEANLGREAIGEANRRRGEIDMTRNDLLNLAQGSTDTETVARQASNQAAQYATPAEFSPIADMFEKYSNDALTAVLANRQKTTPQVTRPLTFSHDPGRSQRNIA